MRLRVARRVAGEGKCTATYVQFLEDLSCGGGEAGRARGIRILAAGFLDYRMVGMSIGVPPPGDRLHTDLAAAELCAALADGSAWIRACCPAALPFSSSWRTTGGKQ